MRNFRTDPRRAVSSMAATITAPLPKQVCRITERPRPPRAWYIAFAISSSATLMFFALIAYLIATGRGRLGQ